MKKLYTVIFIISILFIIFLIVILSPKNYVLNYVINDIKITEEYQKDNHGYLYILNSEEIDYPIFLPKKYTRKRKHITTIEKYEEKDGTCLIVNISGEKKSICSQKGNLIDANTTSSAMKKLIGYDSKKPEVQSTYQNISIYNKSNRFLIWNYKGFYSIPDLDEDLNKFFNKDNYQNSLTYQSNNLLFFPDYDSEYFFTKLYVYDINKKTLKSIISDFEISYESFFLGVYKNKAYLVDKKNKFEYEIDLKKSKFNIISKENTCRILENNVWKNESLTKVINQEIKFSNKEIYNYYLDNSTLYLTIDNYPIIISNLKVKQIVKSNGSKVYYLSEDKLYSYDYLKNEELLLKYPEWNFNYSNHIFIFD